MKKRLARWISERRRRRAAMQPIIKIVIPPNKKV